MSNGDQKILFLTGATGHTGSRVARRLVDEGWRLRCLLHTPARGRFLPQCGAVEIIQGDLENAKPWAEHLRGVQACIHMAHVGFAPLLVPLLEDAGVERVISFSSTRRFTQFPEQTARRVIQGEAALASSSLNYTILRASMIYGGDRDNNMEKIVRWLARCRVMPLVAGGTNLVQPVFVQDLVQAVLCALERPAQTGRRALTVAGPQAMTQRELTETIGRMMGRPVLWAPVPLSLMMAGAWCSELAARATGRKPFLARAQVRRLLEDKTFAIDEAIHALGNWTPRPFEEGIRLKLTGQA